MTPSFAPSSEWAAAQASLASLFASGHWPQAIVIEGPDGEEKDRLAGWIAQAAVCPEEGAPCGQCRACRNAAAGNHPDVIVLEGDGTQKSLSVQRIRDMRAQAFVRPNEAEKKVFLLLNAQCMNVSAQNAMLKILEEPPAYVVFVLTVVSRSQLLATVLSRSVVVAAGRGGLSLPEPAADSLFLRFAQALAKGDEPEMLALSASVERDRAAQGELLEQLCLLFRDALVLRAGGKGSLSGAQDVAGELSRAVTRQGLYDGIRVVDELSQRAGQNANGPLLGTLLCARLRRAVS